MCFEKKIYRDKLEVDVLKISMDVGASFIRICTGDVNTKDITFTKKKFEACEQLIDEINHNILYPLLDQLERMKQDKNQINAIGIALAATFDRKNGQIISWPNHPKWNGFPLREYLKRALAVTILFEDDANAAAWGEFILGAGRNYNSMVYVTVSTGIGAGIIYQSQLFIGNGKAGELGHYTVLGNKRPCSCGRAGCLQTIASGRGLELAYNNGKDYLSLNQISELAHNGDKRAISLFANAGKWIGEALSNVYTILDIPVFIIGGGVSNAGDLIIYPIIRTIKECNPAEASSIIVKKAELGDNSGLIGMLNLPYDGGRYDKADKT